MREKSADEAMIESLSIRLETRALAPEEGKSLAGRAARGEQYVVTRFLEAVR